MYANVKCHHGVAHTHTHWHKGQLYKLKTRTTREKRNARNNEKDVRIETKNVFIWIKLNESYLMDSLGKEKTQKTISLSA